MAFPTAVFTPRPALIGWRHAVANNRPGGQSLRPAMDGLEAQKSTLGTAIACFAAILFALETIFFFWAYRDVKMARLLLDAGRGLNGRLDYLACTAFLHEDFNAAIPLIKGVILLAASLLLAVCCIYAHLALSYAASATLVAVIISSALYPFSMPLVGANIALASILAISMPPLHTSRLSHLRPLTLLPAKEPSLHRGPKPFLYGPSPIFC